MTRPSRLTVASVAIGALALAILTTFALVLAGSQRDAREDIEQRFSERAEIAAALTESLFAATTGAGQAADGAVYSGRVSTAEMDRTARDGNNVFAVLVDSDGALIAKSSGISEELVEQLSSRPPWLEGLFEGATYGLSGVLDAGAAGSAIALASAVDTPSGQRVLITGIEPQLLAAFIGGYLGTVPSVAEGSAYVLDSDGNVIASQSGDAGADSPADVEALAGALALAGTGEYADGRRYASAPVSGSTWRVVNEAPTSSLFASVNGPGRWVPWVIFVLLAIAIGITMLLIRRTLADRDRLATGNAELHASRLHLEQANTALEHRAAQLTRSNAELDQFASVASHDLQEPLRKVQAFSSRVILTEADGLSETGRDYLERASAAAARMQDLIEDLLRFSRVATHTREFVPTDLGAVVEAVVSDLDTVIGTADAQILTGPLPTVPVDPPQARQLFQNLISNALKFRREGVAHEVRIDGATRDGFAEITVADNGIGFEPEYGERIFRVFERLHGRGTYPGTGIGLALCRKIAERHGGSVEAFGQPGEGARFVVRLPLVHQDGDRPDPGEPEQRSSAAIAAVRR